jgi:lipopolysaccharide transport system permease protein
MNKAGAGAGSGGAGALFFAVEGGGCGDFFCVCAGSHQQTTNTRAKAPAKNRIPYRVYTQNVTHSVARIPGRHFLRNLVERRALVWQLVRRDFKTRYIGSSAGWLWGVVHPIVQLLIWIFVFEKCLGIKLPDGSVTTNYTMFLFCGFLPWMLFNETVTRSAGSLVEQSNLITRTVFPSEVVPVSIFLSSLIHHLIGVGLLIAGSFIYFKKVSPMVALLPVYMFFLFLLAVGVSWIVASLHVYLRDTGQVLGVVMMLWFWITPIMMTTDQMLKGIPAPFRRFLTWNPMYWVVGAYRERLFTGTWPGLRELAVLAVYSMGVFIAGGLFFRVLKRGFADVL